MEAILEYVVSVRQSWANETLSQINKEMNTFSMPLCTVHWWNSMDNALKWKKTGQGIEMKSYYLEMKR